MSLECIRGQFPALTPFCRGPVRRTIKMHLTYEVSVTAKVTWVVVQEALVEFDQNYATSLEAVLIVALKNKLTMGLRGKALWL